ncbi:MAG: U32 family peptidase [bacterium]|nr:U32 family peptidase [bacterium]
MKKPELLAPGGTLEKAKFALDFGADAVYCGTNIFALRQHKGNFNYDTLQEIVDYAHERNKQVYVTVNVFAHNHHIKVITEALKKLQKIKPDALIISDAGVFALTREHAPDLPIHISTQASVTNSLGVQFWHKQGAERIILARELNIRELKEIHDDSPEIEIETFIHGAQCMAYSGRCMLSSYMTDSRKANIGSCVNSCRWKYKELEEEQRPGETITVEEDDHGTYIFSANDMCMIEHVNELAEAGIISFKIEGRGRSAFYVARIIKAYREAIDLIGDDSDAAKQRIVELKDVLVKGSSRKYDTGFFFSSPRQTTEDRQEVPTHIFAGIAKEVIDDNKIKVLVKNEIYLNETVKVLTPDDEYEMKIDELILAEDGSSVESAHGGKQDEIILELPKKAHLRTILWIDTAQREKTDLTKS